METMSGRMRVESALRGEISDTVPVALHNFLFAAHYAGHDLVDGLRSGELMAEAQLKVWRDFGHDCLLLENGVAAMAEALGCGVRYQTDVPPHVHEPVLADMTRIDELEVPDPETTYPLTENLKCTRLVAEEAGEEAFIMGRSDQGPMALAAALCGPEQFLLSLFYPENLPLILRILDFCTECNIAYGQAQARAGAHGSCIGGYGTALISPQLYHDIEQPREQRWCQAMQAAGLRSFVHICDNTKMILPEMHATTADGLELDPGTPLQTVRDSLEAGGTAAILGMVDNVTILPRGSAEEVAENTQAAVEMLGPTGRLIVGPGCALAVETPPDNVAALVDTARRYGRYRSDGSLAGAN